VGSDPTRFENRGGYWLKPEAAGLGFDVDESAAAKHPFQLEINLAGTARAADGAVLDF